MRLTSVLALTISFLVIYAAFSFGSGRQDWQFVEVRPGAHMFYWLYFTSADVKHYTKRPLVIWLHGGPGGSSTGSGNFEYFGPMDVQGNKRNNSWVEHVNMLFIDSPVGTGFSYVENDDLYTRSTTQIARDLVTCMKHFYVKHAEFVPVPLHIFSESYGGKMAPEFGLELYKAFLRGEVNANIQSVTVGNPYMSIVETSLAIPSFLLQTGMIDLHGHTNLSSTAFRVVEHLNDGNVTAAFYAYVEVVTSAINLLGDVDVYNINKMFNPNFSYLFNSELAELMRGTVTLALNITTRIEWGAQRDNVFENLKIDKLSSSMPIVQELLNTTPIKIAFYSGHLDIVCPTSATVNLINQMEWRDKPNYLAAVRKPIIIDDIIEGYEKSDGKFSMFWIIHAGHLVQIDNPKALSYILKNVTNYA